ncbi:uncharacterized protein BXZ73DRAFT_45405 [Epithele typhae]|uniref:uncharacterized protein n=1 Tax=Epithele typhae TaxID=378194 RepID=UPI002007F5B0|nr:uncharacterized protein BXZ73DRAFT_45405 [Epithele typhae]KAH9935890.1 hypothetical protein BXZ73DRAFT_45405 [Epithele typhae]
MPGLAMLSPIKESEESPYRARFGLPRHTGQRSPVGVKNPTYVQDTMGSPRQVTMDDLWIYDCYAQDPTSPYPRSPSTPNHNRTISLPVSTSNFVPPNNAPLIREPPHRQPHRPPALDMAEPPLYLDPSVAMEDDPSDMFDYVNGDLPVINTSTFSAGIEYAEYSPLEQEVLTMVEVIDQLSAAASQFAALELMLRRVGPEDPLPDMDEDVAFWFVEALNMFTSDCADVAADLIQFGEFVEALLITEHERALPVRALPRASFSEQDMKEVLASAANIPHDQVVREMAKLEASVPPPDQWRTRERPPSLRLSTNDTVLLQARMPQPRLRNQSVGALGRFQEHNTNLDTLSVHQDDKDVSPSVLRKNRTYVIYGDQSPAEDNWSAKSIVNFRDDQLPFDDNGNLRQVSRVVLAPERALIPSKVSPQAARPRPGSGQSAIPRPLSSPVTFGNTPRSFARGRPPSLELNDPLSPRSSSGHGHSSASSVSSLFSALPRSSFATTSSSPHTSPRLSTFDKGEKPRFPTSSGNIKKMFSNMFKKKERDGAAPSRSNSGSSGSSSRSGASRFGRRTEATGSIDATLSALALGGSSQSPVVQPERDPFAASPPPTGVFQPPPTSQVSPAFDGYSSMFNPLRAASRFPTQPLYGGLENSPV